VGFKKYGIMQFILDARMWHVLHLLIVSNAVVRALQTSQAFIVK
jgi:hypothetical protein